MAKLPSSCSIRSPMAAEFLPFSCPSNPCKTGSGRRNVGCGCVMTGDGTQAQTAKGGIKAQIIHSISNKKVYEDRVKGIACYIDKNGEMVCEGYDEGPRPDDPHLLRDGEEELDVIELLERSWLRTENGSRCTAEAEAEYADEEYIN